MTGPHPAARLCVETLMEQGEAAPARIIRQQRIAAGEGPPTRYIGQEDARETRLDESGDLLQVHPPARADGALDAQTVTVEVVIALQRLDQQVVQREPDRPAPVGVAAEKTGAGFPGHVIATEFLVIE